MANQAVPKSDVNVFMKVGRERSCVGLRLQRRLIPRLAWAAARTPPMPYRLLKLAEVAA